MGRENNLPPHFTHLAALMAQQSGGLIGSIPSLIFFPHLFLSLIAAFLTDAHNMYLGTITCTWVIF